MPPFFQCWNRGPSLRACTPARTASGNPRAEPRITFAALPHPWGKGSNGPRTNIVMQKRAGRLRKSRGCDVRGNRGIGIRISDSGFRKRKTFQITDCKFQRGNFRGGVRKSKRDASSRQKPPGLSMTAIREGVRRSAGRWRRGRRRGGGRFPGTRGRPGWGGGAGGR